MLKKLKREFTLITMGLSGLVLVLALAMTFATNWSTQNSVTSSLLQRGLEEGRAMSPQMGAQDREGTVGADSMLTITVDVTTGGVMLSKSDSPVDVDTDALYDIISQAVADERTSGFDWGHHLAWATKSTAWGMRVAICDTYSRDMALLSQAAASISILCVALLTLYIVSRLFANWAIKPVGETWDQQRRFVSDASHELKTPLAVILANVQILQKDEGLPEDSKRWVNSTADEAQHMKSLVEDLLTLARADEAKAGSVTATGPMVDFDLSEVVEETALEFDAVAFERGCSIECESAPGIVVKGDKAQLSRVAHTLLDNATKYAKKGTEVKVALSREGKKARFTVNNQGSVIAPDDLAHLFDRFYRTDKARSREETGGFGLGLAIAKSIVEAHGGKIEVTSTAQEGTTFTVTI